VEERYMTVSHVCCLYDTDDEHSAVVARFVHDGLIRNDKVLSILDVDERTPFLHGLNFDAMDVPSTIARGQLVFYTTDETYLQRSSFHPARMIAWLSRETQIALDEGYAGLRITSDMGWARRRSIDLGTLLRYEVVVNDFLLQHPCRGLCRYHRWSFPSTILIDLVSLHPLVISQGQVFPNTQHKTFRNLLQAIDDETDL
jgi:hypothetical protein